MMNLWHRIQLATIVARWFWTHSAKITEEHTYSIVARNMQGRMVGNVLVTKYKNGIRITSP